ncbi:hypothetical protein [Alicyclobacillus pomorum]|uniref:hypothetical protein n=1 Tax=Alicyclobacillus pomorum TaxID=204470 RepID=UPI0003FBF8D1|nr:hypothetical protein [Alicyclobacillus pomorum]
MSWHRKGYRKLFLTGAFVLTWLAVALIWPNTASATTQSMVTRSVSDMPNDKGTVHASPAANPSSFYIHADKIQAQGAFLEPISTSGKLGVELRFSELVLYGMKLVKNTSISGSTDAIEIQSTGPVRLNNVTVDVVGLGFRGVGVKLNVLLPDLVLTDVNLMATRLISDEANIPGLSLHVNEQPIGVNTGNMVDLTQIPLSGTLAQVVSQLDSLLNGADPREVQPEANHTDPTQVQQGENHQFKVPPLMGTVSSPTGILTNGNLQSVLGSALSSTAKDLGSLNSGSKATQLKNTVSRTQSENSVTESPATSPSTRSSGSSTEPTSQGPGLLGSVIQAMSPLLRDFFGSGP